MLIIRQKSLKKATALALMEVVSHAFLRGYNGQQEIAPKKNTILHRLFRYIYATKINLCSFLKVETQPVGSSFSLPF
jgi:hypothetical protein